MDQRPFYPGENRSILRSSFEGRWLASALKQERTQREEMQVNSGPLGNSGLKVSELCFAQATFGGGNEFQGVGSTQVGGSQND